MSLGARFLDPSSAEAVRGCYERAAVAAHLPALHATVDKLMRDAAADLPTAHEVRALARPLHWRACMLCQ